MTLMKPTTFVLDVDGVLSNGQFLYSEEGKIYKTFGPHDSDGLKMINALLDIRFISADKRGFEISKKRVTDMGFEIDLVSASDRYSYIQDKYNLKAVIYMGDGYFDVSILEDCFFGIAPAGSRKEAITAADFVTESIAGNGAIMDACIEIKRRFF
jgi:3-deoxy-D-manno-octulosonate 8-phosphate phosphatase (KDO 8-P phosphatase)